MNQMIEIHLHHFKHIKDENLFLAVKKSHDLISYLSSVINKVTASDKKYKLSTEIISHVSAFNKAEKEVLLPLIKDKLGPSEHSKYFDINIETKQCIEDLYAYGLIPNDIRYYDKLDALIKKFDEHLKVYEDDTILTLSKELNHKENCQASEDFINNKMKYYRN
ncbi:hypothetical protein K502DRAFT_360855 [Neoconidiobolus thromboides FSU 785]|nr:hypothetical protein K502DRAFT_360855 [Neoconidiobolus thromboides FSU 785]